MEEVVLHKHVGDELRYVEIRGVDIVERADVHELLGCRCREKLQREPDDDIYDKKIFRDRRQHAKRLSYSHCGKI